MPVPLPPTAHEDALTHLRERLDAVKRVKPKNEAQGRARAAELIRIENILAEAARQAADATAQKQIANHSNGKGHASGDVSGLTDEVLTALAKAIAPFVRARITEALAPLNARLEEQERVLRNLVASAARRQQHE